MKAYGLKNLEYVAAHLSEWTSDVNKDLSELYDLFMYGAIGHVVTNVGGVHEDIKSLIKRFACW
jgi:hypothetical protein